MSEWCSHITKDQILGHSGELNWVFRHSVISDARDWNVCPVCLAKRPEKPNVAVGEAGQALTADGWKDPIKPWFCHGTIETKYCPDCGKQYPEKPKELWEKLEGSWQVERSVKENLKGFASIARQHFTEVSEEEYADMAKLPHGSIPADQMVGMKKAIKWLRENK